MTRIADNEFEINEAKLFKPFNRDVALSNVS